MSTTMFLCSIGLGSMLGVCVGHQLGSLDYGMAASIAAWLITIWVDAFVERKSA